MRLAALAMVLCLALPVVCQRTPVRTPPSRTPETGPSGALPNTIEVTIRAASGGNLVGMPSVVLYQGGTALSSSTSTRASFGGLSDGNYDVEVKLSGYAYEKRSVTVYNGQTQYVVIELRPGAGTVVWEVSDPVISAHWLSGLEAARDEVKKAREARRKGDLKDAATHAERALSIDPNFAVAQGELALTRRAAGDLPGAEQAFRAAIRLAPKLLPAYTGLAEVLAQNKDYNGAAGVLAQAVKAAPDRAEPFKAMAQIQLDTGHFDKAEMACKMGLERDHSRIPEIYVVLANVQLRRGDQDSAAQALQTYLSKAPDGDMAAQVRKTLEKMKRPN